MASPIHEPSKKPTWLRIVFPISIWLTRAIELSLIIFGPEKISGILNSSPAVNNITQPEIIGGMKLRVGNNIFDNSINYQINQLKKTLHNV